MEQSKQDEIFIDFNKPGTAERFSSPEEFDKYKRKSFHIIVGKIPEKLTTPKTDTLQTP